MLLVKLACCLEADTIEQTECFLPQLLFFFFQHFWKRQDECSTILIVLFVDSTQLSSMSNIFTKILKIYIYIHSIITRRDD